MASGLTRILPSKIYRLFTNIINDTVIKLKPIFCLLLLLAAATAGAHDFEVDGIYYNITGDNEAEVTYKGDYYYTDNNRYTGEVTIPKTVTEDGVTFAVTSIGDYAFWQCSGMTGLTIASSVTSIGDDALYGCVGLTSILVENGNPSYDSRDNCNAIIETASNTLIAGCQNTIIPNTVTAIGNGAFQRCSGLTGLIIPNSVTRIGYTAFAFCSELKDVYSYITDLAKVNLGQRIFEDFNDNYLKRTLHVPAGTAEQYRSSFSWYPYFRWIEEMGPNCDVNGDNAVNIGDVNQVIDIILSGHHSDKGDVNGDGVVNISDINAIINYILTH